MISRKELILSRLELRPLQSEIHHYKFANVWIDRVLNKFLKCVISVLVSASNPIEHAITNEF